jgi:sialate O-acetylesterase
MTDKPLALSTLAAILLAAPRLVLCDGVVLKEDYQVLQRDAGDRVTVSLRVPKERAGAAYLVRVDDAGGKTARSISAKAGEADADGASLTVDDLPVGGPYTITLAPEGGPDKVEQVYRQILVGDIWILGGQSNMFGIDVIKESLPALPQLNFLNLLHFEKNAHWCEGLPPIHRIPDALAPSYLKNQHPQWTSEQIQETIRSKTPIGGTDCSYFFARKLSEESDVPVGLIPCATGAALAHWNPDNRDKNRYGFLAHHVASAGGRVKGMLFFQGEQDAIFGDENETVTKPSLIGPITTYGDQFIHFVEALRKEFGGPEMPAIYAQICRHHNSPPDRSRGWEIVREQQRTIPDRLVNAHCVPSIHLNVMDGIHMDYDSLKAIGEQMATLALPYVKKGIAPRQEIRLRSATMGPGHRPRIVVEFSGVDGHLQSAGKPTGFMLKEKETGKPLDWVYKTEFDPERPATVILHATSLPGRDVALYYGAGVAPYVNIVDDRGMSLPAFGPISVQPAVP